MALHDSSSTAPPAVPAPSQPVMAPATPLATLDGSKIGNDIEACGRLTAFIFVNPTSGGSGASYWTGGPVNPRTQRQDLLTMESMRLNITTTSGNDVAVDLRVFDIRVGKSGMKPGFTELQRRILNRSHPKEDPILIIAAGGDGTVCWVLEETSATGIDDQATGVYYSVLPYGTGNDFARATGWNEFGGLRPFDRDGHALTNWIKTWFDADVGRNDLWSIKLELHEEEGSLWQIKENEKGERVKVKIQSREWKMLNYFSMGLDSRIGVGFDRNRVGSQFGNNLVYLNEGLKKLFRATLPVDEWIERMETPVINSAPPPPEGKAAENFFFKNADDSHVKLCKGARSLLFMNVPSYGGGRDCWHSAQKIGLDVESSYDKDNSDWVAWRTALKRKQQMMGDGCGEWLAFKHKVSLGMEQLGKGHSRRVCAAKGPFHIIMKDRKETDRCYFQVDGEFYIVRRPTTIKIEHVRSFRVLACHQDKIVQEDR